MRTLLLLHIYLMVLDTQAIDTLPKPENVTVLSNNFYHILQWSPGIGTPPGTVYKISIRHGKNMNITKKMKSTNADLSKYMKDIHMWYTVSVFALLGNRSSTPNTKDFKPFGSTVIGPPSVTLIGCGDCLNISLSLPKGLNSNDADLVYSGVMFDIHWNKAGDQKAYRIQKCDSRTIDHNRTFTTYKCFLQNLQSGKNYCVQALPKSNTHQTQISDLFCAFTSTVHQRGAFVSGWAAGFVLFGLGVLIITAGLIYSGVLCKWKISMPEALTNFVPSNYLVPEKMYLSVLEVNCNKKSKHHHQREEGHSEKEDGKYDDDDSDDDNNCDYMNRDTNDFESQTTNSGQDSTATTTTTQCEVAENCVELGAEPVPTETEQTPLKCLTITQLQHEELKDDEPEALNDLKIHEPVSTHDLIKSTEAKTEGVQIHKVENGISRNINLFSVILTSVQQEDKEIDRVNNAKEDSKPLLPLLVKEVEEDRLCSSKPRTEMLPWVGCQTYNQFQRNTQAGLQNVIPSKLKVSCELRSDQTVKHDRNLSGYMATHMGKVNTVNECLLEKEAEKKEEEEEDNDFSGYMTQ